MDAVGQDLDYLAQQVRTRPHLHSWYWGNRGTSFAGWQVLGAGFAGASYRAAAPIGTRRMRQWLLLCAHDGAGWFADAQGRRHPWSAGSGVLLAPGQQHAYGHGNAGWIEWWLLFDGPAASAAHAAGEMAADARPQVSPASYRRLANAVAAGAASSEPEAGGRLVALLIEALHARRPEAAAVDDAGIRALQLDLLAHPERQWNLPALARRHGMGYDAMRRRFRAAFGVPPLAFLRRERINRSCKLLLEGAAVADAAHAVGFSDPFFFSRTFRRVIGTSPRGFAQRS